MTNAVETRGLSKFFGSRVALHEVTFSLPSGGILALLGPNGSGKSTLLHDPDLLRLDEPFAGLDEASSVLVAKLFEDLRRAGRTVIVSTHQASHLDSLAPDYLRLNQGRIGQGVA